MNDQKIKKLSLHPKKKKFWTKNMTNFIAREEDHSLMQNLF
jgi:hypothetical protein